MVVPKTFLHRLLTAFLPCPVSRWLPQDFLAQILDGVDWMHVNNIVHRDLKPQNILVSCDGKKLKIADLGLSRSIGSNVVLSTQVSVFKTLLLFLNLRYCLYTLSD